MKQIWKFKIYPFVCNVAMPAGARIISAQVQNEDICIWAECNIYAQMRDRLINVLGTGESFTYDPGEFIATVQQGDFVWHVFDGGEV